MAVFVIGVIVHLLLVERKVDDVDGGQQADGQAEEEGGSSMPS